MIFTKVGIIIAFSVIFAIGLYATPSAFAEHSMHAVVENAAGSSTPGCEPDCFLPATVTIGAGGSVEFVNSDNAAHTSTSGTPQDGGDGVWDSSLVMVNMSYTTPALEAGEYPYFCMVHPWMEGLVIVTDDHSSSTSSSTNSTSTSPPPQPVITLTTNKDSYNYGDTITASGMISNYNVVGEDATFAWKGPTGSIMAVEQEYINSSGGFSNTITFGDSHWEDGTYTLKVSVGEYNAEKTFQVTIPPPPTAPENVVHNAEGSSTPGCEPDCFIPNTITINPGETVEFVNNDNAAHTSTAGSPEDGPSGIWDSSLVMMGASFTTPALSEGTYPYFCMVHPWMAGTVIVGEGGAQTTSEEASQAEAEAAERIAAAEAAAAAAEAEARIAEAEAAARIAEAEAAAKASEEAALAAEEAAQERIAATASLNEKIEISMDFTNDTDVQQPFALIVQIKDSNNTTISLSHVTGMLGAGQTLDQILSYTPTEAGTYTVEKFLWDNFADPTALTDEKETFTLTVS